MFGNRSFMFKFWGVMDFTYVAGIACSFLWWMLFGVRIGEDLLEKFFMFWGGFLQGNLGVVLGEGLIPLWLGGSMIASAQLLLKEDPRALKFVMWQSPFRVYCLMPSLVFIPDSSGLSFGAKLMLWLVFSFLELIKICTLAETEESQPRPEKVKSD